MIRNLNNSFPLTIIEKKLNALWRRKKLNTKISTKISERREMMKFIRVLKHVVKHILFTFSMCALEIINVVSLQLLLFEYRG